MGKSSTNSISPNLVLLYENESIGSSGSVNLPSNITNIVNSNSAIFIYEFIGCVWNTGGLNNYASFSVGTSSGPHFFFRPESGYIQLYYNGNPYTPQGYGYYFQPTAGTTYDIMVEVSPTTLQMWVNNIPIILRNLNTVSSSLSFLQFQRITGTSIASMSNPNSFNWTTGTNSAIMTGFRIWQRINAYTNSITLLGDSITAAYNNTYYTKLALGPYWYVNNCGVGYRQSREMVSAINVPFPGDAYNSANYYTDTWAAYISGCNSNWVLIGIGTNDCININNAVLPAGPLCGGYTATGAGTVGIINTDTVNNILTAIQKIKNINPNIKIAVRTLFNTNGGGSYANCEQFRQMLNSNIMSGSISLCADRIINIENLFCPLTARTDGVSANGICYNPTYWPQLSTSPSTAYSNNSAYFEGGHIHPVSAYNFIAQYQASIILGQKLQF